MDEALRPVRRHRDRALSVADAVADRLRDPAALPSVVPFETPGRAASWEQASLAAGYAGIAMLFSNRAHLSDGADRVAAHRYLAGAAHYLRGGRCTRSFGIFNEVCGLGLSLVLAQQATGGYGKALRSLDAEVASGTERYCDLVGGEPVGPMGRYDVVDGLSGIARYLLLRNEHPEVLERVLRTLVRLVAPVAHQGATVPGLWATNPPNRNERKHPHLQRSGHLNLGLAHGVTGPLALLSIATAHGVVVEGQHEAIRSLVALMDRFQLEDEYGIYWPNFISLDEWKAGRCTPRRARVSWCYGAPGVSRALQLAGRAMGNSAWLRTADASVEAVLALPRDRWSVDHWSLCHGWSGAMHVLGYFADGPLGERVERTVDEMADQLLGGLERTGLPEFWLGEEKFPPGTEPAGFLEGAAGLALVLDSYAHGPALPWDMALLLR
ncbi:hypothetical protein GTY66_21710 [Streptomyces sp. SID8356]|uniref:lanthionine synthetase C family protein n=1 Tax=unclassified Streptomyces TaxID=2593676 RepID=UPI00037FF8A4|nr:lanthionine synthetase C family protein [Streptomyces sp. CcalMP-8W]MYT38650.1 hypothetical protein [Streptomyces sp. SID8356]